MAKGRTSNQQQRLRPRKSRVLTNQALGMPSKPAPAAVPSSSSIELTTYSGNTVAKRCDQRSARMSSKPPTTKTIGNANRVVNSRTDHGSFRGCRLECIGSRSVSPYCKSAAWRTQRQPARSMTRTADGFNRPNCSMGKWSCLNGQAQERTKLSGATEEATGYSKLLLA